MYQPTAVATYTGGNLYIADCNPSAGYGAVIYKVAPGTTVITIVAGTGTAGYSGDGGPATNATFSNQVFSIAVDASGNIYISDSQYAVIRKVTASTGVISTFAGSNPTHARYFGGYNGDGRAANTAWLWAPYGIAVDANYLYIVDNLNYRLRKVSLSTGIISTIAGNGTKDPAGSFGNGGPATSAELACATGIAVDQYGDVYFVDNPTNGDNTVIRKVSASHGTIGPLRNILIGFSYNLATDPNYDLYYIATCQTGEYFPLSGTYSIVAGALSCGYSGDGGPALNAQLNSPQATAIDSSGNVYIADTANALIRKY